MSPRPPLFVLACASIAWAQPNTLLVNTSSLSFVSTLNSTNALQQSFVASSTGVSLPINATPRYFSQAAGWLTISPTIGSTPVEVVVTANPSGLGAGSYLAQVVVTSGFTQSAIVNVTLTVGGGSSTGTITASPSALSFNAATGFTFQTVALSSITNTAYNVQVSTSNGGSWLSASPSNGFTPSTLQVSANGAGLAFGTTYSGQVIITPVGAGTSTTIPVTFTPGNATGLTLSATALTFNYQLGTAAPATQFVLVSSPSGSGFYSATSNATWLRLISNQTQIPSPSLNGSSGTNLSVLIDTAILTAGTYQGQIAVSSGSFTQNIDVTLNVSQNALLTASPSSMTFLFTQGSSIPPSQATTIGSTSGALNFTVGATSTGWLSAGPQAGATNGSNLVSVSVSPGGLPAGTYNGSVQLTSGGTTLLVPVVLIVSNQTVSAGFTVSPQSLAFQAAIGGSGVTQSLSLSASSPTNFLIAVNSGGSNWIQVSAANGVTPATINVTVFPSVLNQAGIYNANLVITNLNDNSNITIPVTANVSSTQLTANPSTMTFTAPAGTSSPVSQVLQLSAGSELPFVAASNVSWLSVTPNSGNAPANVTVSVNPAGLVPGSYQGLITLQAAGNTLTVNVNLTVTPSGGPVLGSTNIVFNHRRGATAPAAQTVNVTSSSSSNVAISSSVRTVSGGDWLVASLSSPTTPATLTVSTVPGTLSPGEYRGVVTVNSTAGGSRSVEVTLVIAAAPLAAIRSILHSATLQPGPISPGLILTIMGTGLGPANGVSGVLLPGGAYQTNYNDLRILFDGVPAPLLFLRDNQINLVVPYSVAGRSNAQVQVETAGVRSDPFDIRVQESAPGMYSTDGSGRGQAAALNENGSLNGPLNPAPTGSVITLFGTGEGLTAPAGQDGRVITTDLRRPLLPVRVYINGSLCEVVYAGSAPGFVSGAFQVNVRIPENLRPGTNLPIEVQVGNGASQDGLVVSVR